MMEQEPAMTTHEDENSIKAFPLEAKIILTGLTKAPEFNGKTGVVKSGLSNGRQQVLVGKKFLGLRPSNMKYHTKPVVDLSLQELKDILKEKDSSINFSGMDAADLRRQVSELDMDLAFEYLANANAKAALEKEKASKANVDQARQTMKDQVDQVSQMSPDQLRQQARMMRSIPPDQIRRMNPQLRHMTDAQISQAADQMEQMADNPDLMRMAANQVKNMTPEEVQRATQTQGAGAQSTAAAAGYGTRTAKTQPGPQSLDGVSVDQLKQQAEMMRSMSKDEIRNLNPQLATFSDDQIEQSIAQMEMMASSPEMFEMVKDQVKGMSPEDIAKMQQQGGGLNPNSMDPAKMFESMDAKQIKQMMNMVKENPDMLKQMLPPGVSEEQFRKTFSMFEGMDDAQMESVLKMMKGVQKVTAPVQKAYAKVNSLCGGHLTTAVGLIIFLYFVMFVYLRFFAADSTVKMPLVTATIETNEPPQILNPEDNEF
jgi:hypothetical protein